MGVGALQRWFSWQPGRLLKLLALITDAQEQLLCPELLSTSVCSVRKLFSLHQRVRGPAVCLRHSAFLLFHGLPQSWGRNPLFLLVPIVPIYSVTNNLSRPHLWGRWPSAAEQVKLTSFPNTPLLTRHWYCRRTTLHLNVGEWLQRAFFYNIFVCILGGGLICVMFVRWSQIQICERIFFVRMFASKPVFECFPLISFLLDREVFYKYTRQTSMHYLITSTHSM